MNRRIVVASGLLVLAGAVLLPAPPAPARQAGETVTLAFKYTPGAVSSYKVVVGEAIDLRLRGAPAGAPGAIPITADLVMTLNQKVVSVAADGTATLQVTVRD